MQSSNALSLLCQSCGSFLGTPNTIRPPLTSHTPHLLGTNRPPSELEARSIRQTIAEAKSTRAHLTNEISQLQATVDALNDEKNTVDQYINDHEARFAPARKILPEILSEIFRWCFVDGVLKGAADAPLVLGQVCSYWRAVANATPSLWSSLQISCYPKVKAEMADTALSRSGASPLDITFRFHSASTHWDERANSCLDAVLNHSRRWKSVYFILSSAGLQKLSSVKGMLPLLEKLDIPADYKSFNGVLDAFEVAPRLRSLRTTLLPNTLMVPLEQLEYLDICLITQKGCIDWLMRCPNLVECRLHLNKDQSVALHSSFTAHLPRLTKLDLWAMEDCGLQCLFDSLVTPMLSDLQIRHPKSVHWAQASFISLRRSASTVRKLHLGYIPLTDVQIIECLRLLPSLMELIIDFRNGATPTDTTLEQLIYQPSKQSACPSLCPRLQIITLGGQLHIKGQVLGDMIASRLGPVIEGSSVVDKPTLEVARLKSVTLQSTLKDIDAGTRRRPREFKEAGLELHME